MWDKMNVEFQKYIVDNFLLFNEVAKKAKSLHLKKMKGAAYKSIIKTEKIDGRTYELHATKGWRSYRS